MGKKVYMRKTTSFNVLKDNGLVVFDFDNGISLEKLDKSIAEENFKKVSDCYSLKRALQEFPTFFKQELKKGF